MPATIDLICDYPPCRKPFTLLLRHYTRRQKFTSLTYCSTKCSARDRARQYPRPTLEERFWAQLTVCEHGRDCAICCWEWQGWRSKGYGKMYVQERNADTGIHVIAWFIEHGAWPTLDTCHTCDNPPCGNIHHLFEGTAADNSQDMVKKGRHSSVTHPESIARGDRNGTRTHPESLARGDDHWTHRQPEKVRSGAANNKTKLDDAQREEIFRLYYQCGWSTQRIGDHCGVSRQAITYRLKCDGPLYYKKFKQQ